MKQTHNQTVIVVTLLFLLICPSVILAEDSSLSEWRYSRMIHVEEEAEYRSISLDEEVYAKVQDGLADLRIIDDQNQFVPFYVDAGIAEQMDNETVYSSEVEANIVIDHDTVVDFNIIPLRENADIQANVLLIDIPEQPFLKYIKVYGSQDGKLWEEIKEDYLYRTEQLHKDRIELDRVYTFAYYRLQVIDNVEGLKFSKLQLLHDEKEINWQQYSKTVVPTFTVENDNQQTTITINNDHRLKVKKIAFQAEGNYLRDYTLDNENGVAIPVYGEKELYNLEFEDVQLTHTQIDLKKIESFSQFTIKIDNGDNKPLDIKNLTMEYAVDKLVFEDNGSESYRLIYGNRNAVKPTYDIEQFKHLIEVKLIQTSELGPESRVAGSTDQDTYRWRVKYIFNGAIICVSILLVIVLARRMGKPAK